MTGNPPGSDGPDIRPGRLAAADIERNFGDMHPPLGRPEALIAADRCYFCFDAPCTAACPTGIDIPSFIQKIRSDNIKGSARTILEENIMGGMCARVCPTEVLCEDACVRNTHEDKPVNIGLLQRYATDPILDGNVVLFERAPDSGRRVAVVGAGPAGLSCAHRLSMLGHRLTIFNRDAKPGGLNEYGIAAYKTPDDFAQREVRYILGLGGIEVRNEVTLGVDVSLAELREEYDAVFLGAGLAGVNSLGIENENAAGVLDAVDYIAELRQAGIKSRLPVGRRVVVIGGGMTAIDIAVQSRLLGAERVEMVYRRGPERMGASRYEQEFAQTKGVVIRHHAAPLRILTDGNARVTGVEFERTAEDAAGGLLRTGEVFSVEADVVFKAVGQALALDTGRGEPAEMLEQKNGKLAAGADGRTSLPGVWAGGDCVSGGDDLTVTAVQQGKLAAVSIDRALRAAGRSEVSP
jgi:dihydropyrimidine dehydrogenase (NAD+) subunit PreT